MKTLFACLCACAALAPAAGAADLAPLLLVANKSDNTVTFIDTATLKTVGTAATGRHPHEIAVSPDGRRAFVTNYGAGDSLSEIDIPARQERGKIRLGEGRDPHGIQVGRDGASLFVTCEGVRGVVALRPSADPVNGRAGWDLARTIRTDQETSHMLVLTPDGRKLYTANIGSGSATAIDLDRGRVLRQIPTGAGCEGIDVTPDGGQVWTANTDADTLTVIDARGDRVVDTVRCGAAPIRVKITPDGRRALVSCARSGAVAVIDVATRREVGRVPTGRAPIGLVIDPSGRRAYVANTADDRVSAIDLTTLDVLGTVATGHGPDGLALAPPGR